MKYVLTSSQVQECLIRGCALVGIIDEQTANSQFDEFGRGNFNVRLEDVANGMIVDLPEPTGAGDGVPLQSGDRVLVTNQPATPTKPQQVANDGPDPEKVKLAIAEHMARPPSITTIRKWSAKERRAAIRWAKDGGDESERPVFVVPRAPRGSREGGAVLPSTEPDGSVELFETEDGEESGEADSEEVEG